MRCKTVQYLFSPRIFKKDHFLLGVYNWPLRAPTLLESIPLPSNFRDPNLFTFFLYVNP